MRSAGRGRNKRDPNAKCACCRDCMDKVGPLGLKCKGLLCQEFMSDAHATIKKLKNRPDDIKVSAVVMQIIQLCLIKVNYI